MTQNQNLCSDEQTTRIYALEPGDGTHYRFMLTWLDGTACLAVPGIGEEQGWVTLTITMERMAGSYEFHRIPLAACEKHYLEYGATKFPHVLKDTVVKIMRAASVLVNRPHAVDEAARKMVSR